MTQHSRRRFIAMGLAGAGSALLQGAPAGVSAAEKRKYNVLFIAVDDLRPQLGCYGDPVVISPNIDRLAADGVLFNRAYCQQAVCSPSRTSLLTGRRPDTTKVYDLNTHFRLNLPNVVTLPQHFKEHGYHTQSFGKIYHGGLDDPVSWSEPSWFPSAATYHTEESLAVLKELAERRQQGSRQKRRGDQVLMRDPKSSIPLKVRRTYRPRGPSWEAPDIGDSELRDGEIAEAAIETLRKVKDKPFFLAVGFLKPHLPFIAPKKYFDLYPDDKIPLASNPFPPKGAPKFALTNWGELRNYSDIPNSGPLSESKAMELIKGYYAAASFTDAQIGRVINELDRLGLREDTVIVLWGDHGWHLGDHGLWCKHTNFENAVHSPLIFSAPGLKKPGIKTDALAEFVDIYPTLSDLCGLPLPKGLEGTSLVPLFDNPDRPLKKAAFSQYPRNITGVGGGMGHSIRTDRYRLTEWTVPEKGFGAIELYDHLKDPDENVNVADLPEYASVVKELTELLHAGWRGALLGSR